VIVGFTEVSEPKEGAKSRYQSLAHPLP
jgi:hypothetical protein